MQISRGPSAATARQWLQAGPSRLGQIAEPPNFAGLLLNGMSAARVLLVLLASDSQLQALYLVTMADGRHLIVSRPFSFSVGICRPSLLGFQSTGGASSTVSWFSPRDTMQHSTAQYDTVEHSTDMTTALQPRRGIPRIRISRLPRVSRTTLPWRAWRPSRFSNVVPPS